MNAVFLVPYPPDSAPGQRFRFEQWLQLLPAGAVRADVHALFDVGTYRRLYRRGGNTQKAMGTIAALLRRIRDVVPAGRADVVFLYREAFTLGPPLLEELLERKVPVVYDFDDAIHLGDTSDANAWIRRLKVPQKVGRIVARSAATTVGNEYLASYARRFSDKVVVLPTTIDVERYEPRPRHPRPRRLVRIGWSGSPTTQRDLHLLDDVLRTVLRTLPVELVVVGAPEYRLEGAANVTVRAWRSEAEIDDVASFDIALMPLRDTEWSRGKCGLKALLSMALGVPTVVSPVGVNTEIVRHDENGLLARDKAAWVEAIGRLVDDELLRRRLGEAGRQTVVERYSGQRWAPTFLEILKEAAGSR